MDRRLSGAAWISPDPGRKFSTPLRCDKCGQKGTATFEENGGKFAKCTATSPFAVSDEFYLRMSIRPTSNMHIVCARCGTVCRKSER